MITKKEELYDTKIHVPTESISKKVQERLFELGIDWSDGYNNVQITDSKHLFVEPKHIMHSNGKDYFDNHKNKEIHYSAIIGHQVGDKVRIKSDLSPSFRKYCGKVAEIIRTNKDNISIYYKIDLDNKNYQWYNCDFEPVTDKRFKVGDKVRLIRKEDALVYGSSGLDSTISYNIGDELTITDIKNNYGNLPFVIKFEGYASYNPDCFELVTEDKPITQPKECNYDREEAMKFFRETVTKVYGLNTMEGTKMELKDMKEENLKEAKDQVEKDKNNAEVEYAKEEYRRLTDKLDAIDRNIKSLQEDKKEVEELLKPFKNGK